MIKRLTSAPANVIIASVFVLLGALVHATDSHAKVLQAPGTRVSMELPDTFEISPLFAGFMDIYSSAAVIIAEMPSEAYAEITKGFTAERLAGKGITDVKTGKLDRDDTYFFVTGEQKHPRAVFEKFILVLRDERNTAIITFNVPKTSYADYISRKTVLAALSSTKLQAKPAPPRDLFTVSYTGPFEPTGSFAGTTRLFTETGDQSPKESRNLLVIAPSLNQLPVGDIRQFSQYAIENLENMSDLQVTTNKDHEIDGMPGHEIVATAHRGTEKTPVTIRQLMLTPSKGGYFRLLAVTRSTDEQRLAPEIDKIFASFKRTEIGRKP